MTENFPLLIIVPTLNSYQLIPRLVNSLKEQSYTNWRLIFIDGGSEDIHIRKLNQICSKDKRFTWKKQLSRYRYIYGAMNYGIKLAEANEWILFWGSDDYAYDKDSLLKYILIKKKLYILNQHPDLIILAGEYYSFTNHNKRRITSFSRNETINFLNKKELREKIFLGSSIPHQSTAFSPKAINILSNYEEKYKLAADLNCFLYLNQFEDIFYASANIAVIKIADSGISGKLTKLRIFEVFKIYRKFFPRTFLVPFLLRYVRKIISKFEFF